MRRFGLTADYLGLGMLRMTDRRRMVAQARIRIRAILSRMMGAVILRTVTRMLHPMGQLARMCVATAGGIRVWRSAMMGLDPWVAVLIVRALRIAWLLIASSVTPRQRECMSVGLVSDGIQFPAALTVTRLL